MEVIRERQRMESGYAVTGDNYEVLDEVHKIRIKMK
jgi:hypothetical protein